jgi:hypothetical protein
MSALPWRSATNQSDFFPTVSCQNGSRSHMSCVNNCHNDGATRSCTWNFSSLMSLPPPCTCAAPHCAATWSRRTRRLAMATSVLARRSSRVEVHPFFSGDPFLWEQHSCSFFPFLCSSGDDDSTWPKDVARENPGLSGDIMGTAVSCAPRPATE